MESEKSKEGDPFPTATHEFSEAVDFAPARNHQDGTKLIAMESSSEEVTQEKEEISFSQDLAFLFVVEEQIWGRLSNSVQKETSVGLERSQRDTKPRSKSSEGEGHLCMQEAHDISSHERPGHHTAVSSLSTPPSSFVNAVTQAQDSSSPSEVVMGKVDDQAFTAGFPQALNVYDTCPEVQGEETTETESVAAQKKPDYECLPVSHDTPKCHQDAESLEARSGVNHSWERDTWQEMGKGILESVEIVRDTEMHPYTKLAGQIESGASTKNEEQEVRDLKEERVDLDLSAPFQSSIGSSEDRRTHADRTQTEPGGILSLISPEITENHLDMEEKKEEPVENSSSDILHFLAREEGDGGEIGAHSLKEIIKIKSAESYMDYGKSEADQKELLQKEELESAEIEDLELRDNGCNRRKKILDWRGMENKIGGNDKPDLEQDAQGGQGWDMKKMKASRGEVQRSMATIPVTPVLDTLSNVASADLNQDSSLAKVEGSEVSLEQVYPSSHYPKTLPESCVRAAATPFARTPTEGLSPKTQPPICLDSTLLLEDSGMYDQADYTSPSGHNGEQPIEEDRKGFIEKEVSESAEDEKSVTDGEGMVVSCEDLILPANPEDLHDLQHEDYPIDAEIHILPVSLGIKNAASAVQVNADKGSNDCIIGNAGLCEKPDSLQGILCQDLAVSCHLDLVDHEEASAVGGDMVDWDSNQKSSSIEDFHENVQDSSSKSLQNISLGEGLYDTAQQTIELSHVSSCTTRDPVSFKEKDSTVYSFEKPHQHQKPPMESFLFPGKDKGADALYMEQQILSNESAGLSDCGQNGTEGDHSTDSPTSLDILFSNVTDVTQLTKPLTSVPVSEQTSALEHTSTHFGQLSLFASDLSQPVQSLAHPHNANATTHAALVLHPRHPSQHEKQLSSSSETSQFLAPIESPQSSTPSPDAGHFEQPAASDCYLNQYKQLPESSHSQPFHLVQLGKSNQSKECIASGSNTRLPTEEHNLAGPLIQAIDNLTLTSGSSNLLNVGVNQFVQHSVEAPVPNLPINCAEGDDWAHASVPIANLDSQRTPSVYESKHLSKLHNMESRVEEFSVAKLAESEGTGPRQDQKDWNIPGTYRNLGVDLLGTQSDSATLENDTFAADNFSSISKTMSMDTQDGKASFDLKSHHLVESQKRCEATESRNSKQTPLLLAFTNPIHFLQLGPPSPPTTRHPQRSQADSQEPQWWQAKAEIDAEDTTMPKVSQQVVGDIGSFKMDLRKPVMEPSPAVIPRKNREAKHLPLEKSSSCPYKNVTDTKGAPNSKKQEEERIKHRTKSKDWHRQGVRKTSIPTDSVLGECF